LAEIGDSLEKKKTRRNHIPKREWAKKTIHHLIVEEGLSNAQLCERLQIPRRTLERYLYEIFQEDNDILLRPTAEDIAMQSNLFIERLLVQRQHLLKDIAYNPDVQDADAKVAAHELAIEMIWAVRKLSVQTPADVIRHTRVMEEIVAQQQKNKELTNVRYLPLKSTE
jgi:hypothetical protein